MSKAKSQNQIIIDGTDLVLGRISAILAKRLLMGQKIALINAEKIVITGNKRQIIDKYVQRTQRKTRTNPLKGPFQPRRPDMLVKKTVRGMLPRKNNRGMKALNNLKVYIGEPAEFEKLEKEDVSSLHPKEGLEKIKYNFMTVGELSREIGWNPIA